MGRKVWAPLLRVVLFLLPSLLVSLPFDAAAQSTPRLTDAPTFPLSGMHALAAGSALVWAESVHSFQMWQVDVNGAGADVQARWTSRILPAELEDFKKHQRNYQPLVSVYFDGGVMRVFWVDAERCPARRGSSPCVVPVHIHQAQSADGGQTWQLSISDVEREPGVSYVQQCVMLDGQVGWILVNDGDGGFGAFSEMVATTSDGGHTWRKVADWAVLEPTPVPFGEAGAQLIVTSSPTAVSLVASAWWGPGGDQSNHLAALQSEDSGLTWTLKSIPEEFPWCEGCTISSLGTPKVDQGQPGHVCFDAGLIAYDKAPDVYRYGAARYCSTDGGRTWRAAVRLSRPAVALGDTGPGLMVESPTPVYADAQLGFATAWGDHRAAGWKNDGNPRDTETWRDYHLYETMDGGETWNVAPASMAGHYAPTESVEAEQAEIVGNSVWLRVTTSDGTPHSGIFYSANHGGTWQPLLDTGSPPAEKTFKSTDGSFQFEYPGTFAFCKFDIKAPGITWAQIRPCGGYFAVCDSVNDGELSGSAAACVAYPAGDSASRSDLEAAAFLISKPKNLVTEAQCLSVPEYALDSRAETISGVTFEVAHNEDAGTGNAIDTYAYRTFHVGQCYELDLNYASGTYVSRQLTATDQGRIWGSLRQVLRSFQFLK